MLPEINKPAYFRPIIPILISLILGIILGTIYSGHQTFVLVLLVMNIGLLIYLMIYKKWVHFSALLFICFLGYLSIQPWLPTDFPSNHIIHFADDGKVTVHGVVDSTPLSIKDRHKFILNVEDLLFNNETIKAVGRIRVTIYGSKLNIEVGDRIRFKSRIRSIRNFNNPGGFNYKRYMMFKKVWGTSYAKCDRVEVFKHSSDFYVKRLIIDVRKKISGLIETTGEGDHRTILKALIIGQRHEIPLKLSQGFNRAGVGHLLAISGLHIGIIATASFFIFSWLLARIHYILWNGWVKKCAAFLTFIPIISYALLAGMSASTQRALLMVTVFLLTFLFKRDQDLFNTISIAAVFILLLHPPSLYSISFQLSFISVFFIIYGLSWVKKLMPHQPKSQKLIHNCLLKFFYFFLVSLFAIFGTLPIVMYYFNQVSLIGLLANLICVPLIGFIVVPMGLLSTFLSPICMAFATWLMKINSVVLNLSLKVIQFFSDQLWASVKTFTPSIIEIICYYLLILIIMNIYPSRDAKRKNADKLKILKPANGFPHPLALKWIPLKSLPFIQEKLKRFYSNKIMGREARKLLTWAGLFIFMVVMGVDVIYWLNKRFWHDELRVTIIDVGQGSSNLLELPGGSCILIDGGGFSDNSVFDVGERVVAPLLWRKKIMTVDTLILTHPNSDHLNGLIFIASHFNVKNIWTNGEEKKTQGYRQFKNLMRNENVNTPLFHEMQRNIMIKDVNINILYPPRDYLSKKKLERWRNSNNNSLVVKINYGLIQFLFPGDIMTRAEKEIIQIQGNNLSSNVLIVPHHGSNSSSSMDFLNKVQPEIAIFSTGWKNRYHFPHASIIDRYKKMGCRIFRTDYHGAVTLLTNGRSVDVIPNI